MAWIIKYTGAGSKQQINWGQININLASQINVDLTPIDLLPRATQKA